MEIYTGDSHDGQGECSSLFNYSELDQDNTCFSPIYIHIFDYFTFATNFLILIHSLYHRNSTCIFYRMNPRTRQGVNMIIYMIITSEELLYLQLLHM